jgi:hypothetical protein
MEVYLIFHFLVSLLILSLVISTPIAVSSSSSSPLFPLLLLNLYLYLNLSFDVMLTPDLLTLPMIYQQH